MDEFEKWLEAITIPVDFVNGNEYRLGYRKACLEIAAKYRAFKDKQEPLAVLAVRKGAKIGGIQLDRDGWVINIDLPHIYDCECVVAPSYPEAEAKARAYLNGPPDKGGE